MISEERLSEIAENPDSYGAEAVAMAQEILQLRRTLGTPWAVVQSLGERYVEDGNAAMIWPANLAEHNDIYLYRLSKNYTEAQNDPPTFKPRGQRNKIPTLKQ